MSLPPDLTSIGNDELCAWPLERLTDLHLELGQQCNVRCSMCYQVDFSPKTKLPEIVWKERLRPAYAFAESLTIQGGEPTIMSNCRELLEIVARDYSHLRLVTVTNGIRFQGLWEDVFLSQGSYVNFSLNALQPEIYNRVVQFGRQDAAIANLQRLIKRKRDMGANLIVRISTVVMDDTVAELPVFMQWAVDNGLDQVLYHTDTMYGVKHSDPMLVQRNIAETYAVSDRNPHVKLLHLDDFDWYFAKQHNISPVRARQVLVRNPAPCEIAFNTLFVSHRGHARPCCKSWFVYGNLVTHSLLEVWNSRHAYRFRKRMLNLQFPDCMVACDLNCNPIHPRHAAIRKAFWGVRNDPHSALKKAARKFRFTSAQSRQPLA